MGLGAFGLGSLNGEVGQHKDLPEKWRPRQDSNL